MYSFPILKPGYRFFPFFEMGAERQGEKVVLLI